MARLFADERNHALIIHYQPRFFFLVGGDLNANILLTTTL
jgi:hypothetical protein